MLSHIHIKNFALIDELALDFQKGLTVLTGETGAGKSIIIDALALALGERADNGSSYIRNEQTRCEITAIFDIRNIPAAVQWLAKQEFEPENQCIFYRMISSDGRSRSSINGRILPLQSLRELAALLITIFSQNQHQALLKRQQPLVLLDAFSGSQLLSKKVEKIYIDWQQASNTLKKLVALRENQDQRKDLINFYIQELDNINIKNTDFFTIQQEYQELNQAENYLENYNYILNLLPNTVTQGLYQAIKKINTPPITELLNNALLYTEEAIQALRLACNTIEINPDKLAILEEQINTRHTLARKHRVNTEDLPVLYQKLCTELTELNQADQNLDNLKIQIEKYAQDYNIYAEKLSLIRNQAAKKLGELITEQIKTLGMPQAQFTVQLLPQSSPAIFGMEQVEFLVSVNPGQPLQAINKVASGGELSRIALALHVTTQEENKAPTMVFDEVDVGIGGSTAERVGKLLRQLSNKNQILCITHLPQVAAQGQQHWQVKKNILGDETYTTIIPLSPAEKIQEIARMLGGITITPQTLAHAESMLSLV